MFINILDKSKLLIVYLLLIYSLWGLLLYNTDIYVSLSYWLTLLTSITTTISLFSTENKILQGLTLLIGIILSIAFITNNFLIWYISFETVLIPMIYILSTGTSSLISKHRAFYRFVIYTLLSGFSLLGTILLLLTISGSLNYWYYLITNPINIYIQLIIFPINLISYLIKLPIIPFHIWLPDTHGEAPTIGSIILAALLLKLGGVGLLRWLIPIFPYGYFYYRPLIYLLGILSSIYASITTLRHIDIKKLIAYSSIAHMGYILVGTISISEIAIKGIIYLLFSHGLVSSLLFYLIGTIYDRTGTRIIIYYKGYNTYMPLFSIFLFISLLMNASFPPSFSFWAEIHILSGIFIYELLGSFFLLLASFFAGAYSILLFCKIVFGSSNIQYNNDLTLREFIIILSLILISFITIIIMF